MPMATACTPTWSARRARSWPNCNKPDLSARINFVSGQVAQLVERSPEKAGVGGSIPSLATTLTLLELAFRRLFFCLCQICAVDCPNQVVLEALILGCPLRIVPADYGGTVPENAGDLL